ncbi:DUF397 domain-containing protein [Streptomyces sp. NBC_01433]|uniref:DUF397 domain-containing protein n=1 Tax=unclassified Streptomyces TaxID=2593676 RepID=UPI00225AD299|nr:DUF397 domain-containing protein [Streptomyces sp. NBC_01433]MCX4676552.1 DUF397 domain-containing protein [Streptomyces sp. NBC_01433]
MTFKIVIPFRKSSYSDQQGNCLEVAHTDDEGCAVRDSKFRDQGTQFYAASAWSAFMSAVTRGVLSVG